jgi:hypothetical protein
MAHDLVPKMSPYLDRHLVFPLLEFLQEKEVGVPSLLTGSFIERFAAGNPSNSNMWFST